MVLKLETGAKLVCATHNAGKAVEIAELLDGRFQIVTAGALGLPEPEEVDATFVGNAVLKARAAADASGLIAIADDSWLSITALGGAPGIYSARWAETGAKSSKGGRDFAFAMSRVEQEMIAEGGGDHAWFTSALAVAWPHGAVAAVEGRVDGHIVFPGRGERGFGYDPIFIPDGEAETFGEMDPDRKNAMSHRACAFEKLKAALF
jgi:XTP/dITP diphosphohydrolase